MSKWCNIKSLTYSSQGLCKRVTPSLRVSVPKALYCGPKQIEGSKSASEGGVMFKTVILDKLTEMQKNPVHDITSFGRMATSTTAIPTTPTFQNCNLRCPTLTLTL